MVWVTTLDPRLSLTEQPIGLRRIIRGAAIGALGAGSSDVGMRLSGAGPISVPGAGWNSSVVDSLLQGAGFVLVVFTVVGVTFYFSRLAERMPDPKRARKIWLEARNAGICFLALFAMVVSEVIELEGIVGCFGGILSLATLYYALVLMGTWWSFRKKFKRYLAEAKGAVRMKAATHGGA